MLRHMILLAALSSLQLVCPTGSRAQDDSRAKDMSDLPPHVAEKLRTLAARIAPLTSHEIQEYRHALLARKQCQPCEATT